MQRFGEHQLPTSEWTADSSVRLDASDGKDTAARRATPGRVSAPGFDCAAIDGLSCDIDFDSNDSSTSNKGLRGVISNHGPGVSGKLLLPGMTATLDSRYRSLSQY